MVEAVVWERASFREIARRQRCHVKNVWRVWKRALKRIEDELGPIYG